MLIFFPRRVAEHPNAHPEELLSVTRSCTLPSDAKPGMVLDHVPHAAPSHVSIAPKPPYMAGVGTRSELLGVNHSRLRSEKQNSTTF